MRGFRWSNTNSRLIVKNSGTSFQIEISGSAELSLSATAFSPAVSDGNALGTGSLMWGDLFLASGGVINFNNGDVTITHSANLLAFAGASTGYTFDAPLSNTSSILSSSATAGIGYSAGAGGTVTQITSKGTGVTLNTVTGIITMNNASLAADTTVAFVLTNSAIVATDAIVCIHESGGTIGAYAFGATAAAGTATISVHNTTPGALGEAVVIRFVVIKSVNA